jgi:hypothetical protein
MSIRAYFNALPQPAPVVPKRKVGRPSKNAKAAADAEERLRAERREAQELEEIERFCDQEEEAEAQRQRKTQKREAGHTNWSLPPNLEVMTKAVEGWLDGSAQQAGYSSQSTWAAHCHPTL